jgi:signal peptidase II
VRRLQERGAVAPVGGRVRWRQLWLALAVAAAVVAVDQVTTSLVLADLHHPVQLVGPFSLRLELNSGVAFSLGQGHPDLVTALVVLVCAGIVVAAGRAERAMLAVSLGLILGGALGNLADRLFRHEGGAVVDFLASTFWPTFNVADSAIVVGSVLLLVSVARS